MKIDNYEQFPAQLSIIVEEELFLYPFMITPIYISDKNFIQAVDGALKNNSLVLVVSKKSNGKDHFNAGVIGSIMRKVPLPDGRVKILFQGMAKGKILEFISDKSMEALVDVIHTEPKDAETSRALLNVLRDHVRIYSQANQQFSQDLLKTIENNKDLNRICDLVASTCNLNMEQSYEIFIQTDLEKKVMLLVDFLIKETELLKLQKNLKTKVHSHIEKVNKEYFLKEQLKQIQQELGTDTQRDEEIEEYKKKLELKKPHLGKDAYKEIKKQIDKLARMHPDSADASMTQSYLDWVIEIPFENKAKKNLNIAEVSAQLNKDHYALNKPKERIEEYFAVKELLEKRGLNKDENKGAILCFIGPPGVGKTSLANSIAKALKRELIRIALGGLEDVNELRGHRRTYIGAMPGRIVQGLIEAKQMNPVVVLDEIDKVSRSHRGDPTAVLLEILDPEQNNKYRDYYLNFNIDLSSIIFVATANDISSIPAPLRDRMEFITLSSYTPQEKFYIAKKYLIPQELKKHGLKAMEVNIAKTTLNLIIENYTRESGVRNLRRKIAELMRKVAKILLLNPEEKKVNITNKNIKDFLEKQVFEIEAVDKQNTIGQVNGLAWTSVGGDVLKIEAIKIKGKGNLQITGSLGDVMKESAGIALSVIKVLMDSGGVKIKNLKKDTKPNDFYQGYNLHIHVPEGATPKDGPSAGITIATAIASIFSQKKVKNSVAMTGEITLSGKVLPIGGLKEKLIAAHKAKIKTALIPQKNYDRDLEDIPDEVKQNMQIVPVNHIKEVLKYSLI